VEREGWIVIINKARQCSQMRKRYFLSGRRRDSIGVQFWGGSFLVGDAHGGGEPLLEFNKREEETYQEGKVRSSL